jgi:hypothetical protein
MKKSEVRKKVKPVTAKSDRASLPVPPALAMIGTARDHLATTEFARAFNRAPQTVRKNYCEQGACFGIRPIKIGGRLLWPIREIVALLNGEE